MREARSALVPNEIDEESFWRNYFFRVNLLKRAFNVSEKPQLKDGALLPKPSVLRSSLASSGSSVGHRDISDPPAASASNPSNSEEPNINGLLADSDADHNGTQEESSASAPSLHQSDHPAQHSADGDFYDPEDASTSSIGSQFFLIGPRSNSPLSF